MEKLTVRDWSFIARCLDQDASDGDLIKLKQLLLQHPGLQQRLQTLQPSLVRDIADFDAVRAFEKLDDRLRQENLI